MTIQFGTVDPNELLKALDEEHRIVCALEEVILMLKNENANLNSQVCAQKKVVKDLEEQFKLYKKREDALLSTITKLNGGK